MTTWKELPASQTNDFEVHQRVRVFGFWVGSGFSGRDATIVEKRGEDGWRVQFHDTITEADFHWKNIRKLIEVKPREWTLFMGADGEPCKKGGFVWASGDRREGACRECHPVRVREVIE